jgi:curved DNA-binding protein CbpA
MEQGDDPYKILGVSKTADADEIKKAYRKLALKNHPDKQRTDEAREQANSIFARIAAAYEITSDPTKRRDYDALQTGRTKTTRGYDPKRHPVNFSDPYEVFKRAFEERFGVAYPGAEYDHLEPNGKGDNAGTGNKEVSRKTLQNGNSKSKGRNQEGNSPKSNKSGTAANKKDNNVLALLKPNDRQLTASTRAPNDNCPNSMKTTTRQVKHKDGVVETIEETTITRPDGSTETLRTSDRSDKQPGWQKAKPKKQGRLTNGPTDKPRLLTNGSSTKGNKKQQPPVLALENGPTAAAKESPKTKRDKPKLLTNAGHTNKPRLLTNGSSTKGNKKQQPPVLALENGPAAATAKESPKTKRGWFGRKQ